jgi:hypothetical protein
VMLLKIAWNSALRLLLATAYPVPIWLTPSSNSPRLSIDINPRSLKLETPSESSRLSLPAIGAVEDRPRTAPWRDDPEDETSDMPERSMALATLPDAERGALLEDRPGVWDSGPTRVPLRLDEADAVVGGWGTRFSGACWLLMEPLRLTGRLPIPGSGPGKGVGAARASEKEGREDELMPARAERPEGRAEEDPSEVVAARGRTADSLFGRGAEGPSSRGREMRSAGGVRKLSWPPPSPSWPISSGACTSSVTPPFAPAMSSSESDPSPIVPVLPIPPPAVAPGPPTARYGRL